MPNDPLFYAWFACVLCIVFTLRSATAFAQKEPAIFLALCIYAGHFAILTVFYTASSANNAPTSVTASPSPAANTVNNEVARRQSPSDLLPALAGYFAALTGFLIVRRHHYRKDGDPHHVRSAEEAVAWLLLLVALPRALSTPFGHGLMPPLITEAHIQVFVTLVLDTIGYWALYRAVHVSQRATLRRALLSSPLQLYWGLNITYSALQLYCRVSLGLDPYDMPTSFRYAFAIAKVVTVITFVPAVVAPFEPFNRFSWKERFSQLFYRTPED
jgi:hypothetical protein